MLKNMFITKQGPLFVSIMLGLLYLSQQSMAFHYNVEEDKFDYKFMIELYQLAYALTFEVTEDTCIKNEKLLRRIDNQTRSMRGFDINSRWSFPVGGCAVKESKLVGFFRVGDEKVRFYFERQSGRGYYEFSDTSKTFKVTDNQNRAKHTIGRSGTVRLKFTRK